jgi:hypothetical protein
MEVGVEKWWNGAMAAEEDTMLAREPGLWMKSPSTEVDASAIASIEGRTCQSPQILLPTRRPRWPCAPPLVLRVAGSAQERESEVSTPEEKGSE